MENGGANILRTAHFASNSSVLNREAAEILDQIVEILKTRPDIKKVEVIGHASSNETNPARVSSARAATAVRYLVGHGVDAARLAPRGAGTAFPVESDATPEGRAFNRRLQFSIVP